MKMRFILLGGVFVSATLGVRADLVVNQSTAVPGAITPVSSSDSFVPSSTRRYVWQADPAATWYELYVTHNGSVFCDQWYASTNSLVDIATGNFAVDVIGHGGGTYQWRVRGWSPDGLGPWSNVGSFAMAPPPPPGPVSLVAPANNASLQARRPQFIWTQSVPESTWFRLYVSYNGSIYLDQWIQGATNWTPTADLPVGSYFWWVQPYYEAGLGPWSTNASFVIPWEVPAPGVLVSPTRGSVVSNSKQLYAWQADEVATWYEVYVLQNGKVLCDKWFTLSSLTNSVAQNGMGVLTVEIGGHTGGIYQWWVRGWSVDGLGLWSIPATYAMATMPSPGAVELLAPANNANVLARQPEFTWTASSPEASWYEVYVVRNLTKYLDQWVAGTTHLVPTGLPEGTYTRVPDPGSLVVTNGLPGGMYTWWVRSWSEAGYGPWSGTGSFTMAATPESGAVTLLTPTNNANVVVRQPEFTWTASSPTNSWYYLYVMRNGTKYLDQWVQGTTSWVVTSGLPGGTYDWWVHPWSEVGYAPWSSKFTFTIQTAVPGAIRLVSPSASVAAGSAQR